MSTAAADGCPPEEYTLTLSREEWLLVQRYREQKRAESLARLGRDIDALVFEIRRHFAADDQAAADTHGAARPEEQAQ